MAQIGYERHGEYYHVRRETNANYGKFSARRKSNANYGNLLYRDLRGKSPLYIFEPTALNNVHT